MDSMSGEDPLGGETLRERNGQPGRIALSKRPLCCRSTRARTWYVYQGASGVVDRTRGGTRKTREGQKRTYVLQPPARCLQSSGLSAGGCSCSWSRLSADLLKTRQFESMSNAEPSSAAGSNIINRGAISRKHTLLLFGGRLLLRRHGVEGFLLAVRGESSSTRW